MWRGRRNECQGLFINNLSLFFVPVLHWLLIPEKIISSVWSTHIYYEPTMGQTIPGNQERENKKWFLPSGFSEINKRSDKTQLTSWRLQATHAMLKVMMEREFQSWLTEKISPKKWYFIWFVIWHNISRNFPGKDTWDKGIPGGGVTLNSLTFLTHSAYQNLWKS